jgi:hypothetical protein
LNIALFVAGQAGAKTQLYPDDSWPSLLYYYSEAKSGMGGGIQVTKTNAADIAAAAAAASAASAAKATEIEQNLVVGDKVISPPSWEQVTAFTKSRLLRMGYQVYDSDMSTMNKGNGIKLPSEIVRWKLSGMVLGLLIPGGDWSGSEYDPFRQVLKLHNNHENWFEVMRLTCYTRHVEKLQSGLEVVVVKEDAGCDYHFLSEGKDMAKGKHTYGAAYKRGEVYEPKDYPVCCCSLLLPTLPRPLLIADFHISSQVTSSALVNHSLVEVVKGNNIDVF